MRDRIQPHQWISQRSEENVALILMNIGMMLGLLGLHLIFRPVLGVISACRRRRLMPSRT